MAPIIRSLPRKLQIIYSPSTADLTASINAWNFPDLTLEITGGSCRSDLSLDGLVSMICHEFGHLAGGPPFRAFIYPEVKFSVEGAADFFAASVCLPEVFKNEDNQTFLQTLEQKTDFPFCKDFSTANERATCARIALASLNLARYLYANWDSSFEKREAGPLPSIQVPSNEIAATTLESHPTPQCRLDTFLLGDRCPVIQMPMTANEFSKVPSKCGLVSEISRPVCWYRSTLSSHNPGTLREIP